MSRPRVLLRGRLSPGGLFVLEPREARRLTKTLRLKAGETVGIFDGRGLEGEARIQRTGRGWGLEVLRLERALWVPSLRLNLVQGLARPQRLEWVLQKSTELGVSRVGLLRCRRCVSQPQDLKDSGRWRRWCRIMEEASRQCGRAEVPDLLGPWELEEFVEFQRGARGLRLVLWEEARSKGLREALEGRETPPGEAWVVVGPEGGLEEREVERLVECGFEAVGLGPRILRTETAGIAALAILQFSFGDLGGRRGEEPSR
ncbi:MAG: RsmE family RNA methyltransferase [Thermodesulfobacteriota bacterium]